MCRCFELYVQPPSWFFPPMGNPVETAVAAPYNNNTIYFFNATGGLATLSFYSLSLWLTSSAADFVCFSFYVCTRQKKKRKIFSLHFSHTHTHTKHTQQQQRSQALWRFVCSLCSFSLLPADGWTEGRSDGRDRPPATYFCFHFVLHFYFAAAAFWYCCCCFMYIHMYVLYRHVYIFIFHIFGLFFDSHTQTLCFVAFIIFHFMCTRHV